MKLDKTLNFKKVRCVKAYDDCLKIGKEYDVIDVSVEIKVKDDEGAFLYWESDHFEPVLDSAENPLQDIELTPEFEAVEPVLADNCQVNIQDIGTDILDTNADIKDKPKFKVGDKVYYGSEYRILTIAEFDENGWIRPDGWIRLDRWVGFINDKQCCHATQENYEMLCKLYPHIEFEQPPKPLTGSDLARAMFDKGHEYVVGRVGNHVGVYYTWSEGAAHFFEVGGTGTFDIEPIDPRTGELLTESVLND